MRRQRKTRLSDTELRAMGLTPNLVTRWVRSADSPDVRKKFGPNLISSTVTNEDTRGEGVLS